MSTISKTSARDLRKKHNKWLRRKLWQYKAIYLMVIPVFVYFAIFTFYPLGLGLVQSFQKVKLIGAAKFIGLDNYRFVFSDPVFIKSLRNSVVVGTVSLFINLAVAMMLTISVNEIRNKAAQSLIQTVTFLPYLFSWTVVGGMWLQILAHNGMVNNLMATL
ncbi:MAG: sugar ABC transporter permease, partial [Clostridiales bacterium]|nr:sugar ABC transporter permease [Clostridiales bacterium]